MARKGLNAREHAFVVAFMGSARGNGTKAAITAGYSRKTAASLASRLLRKVNVREAVVTFRQARERKGIADAVERDEILSGIARHSTDEHAQILSVKELNKVSGRHSIKHVLDVAESLADIIAGSRSEP